MSVAIPTATPVAIGLSENIDFGGFPRMPLTEGRGELSERYDVIIVGGGAAGLSAALVLGRCRRRIRLYDDAQHPNAVCS